MSGFDDLPPEIAAEIARLNALDLAGIRQRWHALFGNGPPKSLRRAFLVKACAYQIKVNAFGGLKPATKRRLKEIAEAVRSANVDAVLAGPRIKPGTQLLRLWQGTTHTVIVIDEGYLWNGERHRSLSAIAKAITGTNWNGYAFFGLKRAPAGNKNAAGPRRKARDG